MPAVSCPYCGLQARLVAGKAVYPRLPDLWDSPCNAYVGVHEGTELPYGTLANAALRQARRRAHEAFDPIWGGDKSKRKAAYAWLAGRLGVSVDDCHIGGFDLATCARVVVACDHRRTLAMSPRLIQEAVPRCPRCGGAAYTARTQLAGDRLELLELNCGACDADILAAYAALKR